MLLYRKPNGEEVPITNAVCVATVGEDGAISLITLEDGEVDATYPSMPREKAAVYAVALIGGFEPPRCLIRPATRSQQHVSNWLNRDKQVPPGYVLAVAEAAAWQVTPHELRPDIYPNPTDGLPADDPRREPVKVAA